MKAVIAMIFHASHIQMMYKSAVLITLFILILCFSRFQWFMRYCFNLICSFAFYCVTHNFIMNLVTLENIPCINLIFNIIQTLIVSIGNYSL